MTRSRRPSFSKVLPLADLIAALGPLRAQGRTVVFTNGCYYLVHAGHLALAGFCMLGVAAATSGQAVLIKNVLDDVLIAKN